MYHFQPTLAARIFQPLAISGFAQNEVQVESMGSGFFGARADQEVFVGDTVELGCTGEGAGGLAPVSVRWSKAGGEALQDNVRQKGNVLR